MATFTAKAILSLEDKSSREIRKVNAELKKLLATSRQLERMTGSARGIRNLTRELDNLHRAARRPIVVRADTSQATRAIRTMQTQARQQITARVTATGGVGGLGGGGGGTIRNLDSSAKLLNTSFLRLVGGVTKLAGAFAVLGAGMAVARRGAQATVSSEDAATRMRQAGFTEAETQTFVDLSREVQEKFPQVSAAEILNASVEQMTTLKIAGKSTEDYRLAMERIAANAQRMSVTFKDAAKGAEQARQAERLSQLLGADVDRERIRVLQEAAQRAIIASGGEMTMEEAVRSLQQLGPVFAKTLTPQAITDLLLTREEGGRASTAEWRMALQDITRATLSEADELAQIKLGLRHEFAKTPKEARAMEKLGIAGGATRAEVARAAAENPVNFVRDTIVPILEKAGVAGATSAEIGAWLDEFGGFTTSGARALADLAVSLRDGEVQRQREAAQRVNLDPNIGANTFRGAIQELTASFDTAVARNMDKLGPKFAEGIKPFSDSIDKVGVQIERGDLGTAVKTMTDAAVNLVKGPAGTALSAMATVEAAKTLLTPSTSLFEKGAAALVIGANALIQGASLIGDFFGSPLPDQRPSSAGALAGSLVGPPRDLSKEWIELRRQPDWQPIIDRMDEIIKQRRDMEQLLGPRGGKLEGAKGFESPALLERQKSLNQTYLDLMKTGQTEGLPRMGDWLQMSTDVRSAFLDGSTSLTNAITTGATTGGTTIATAMSGAAPGWGSAMAGALSAMMPSMGAVLGSNAAAQINAATVNVRYAAAPDTGAQTPIQ